MGAGIGLASGCTAAGEVEVAIAGDVMATGSRDSGKCAPAAISVATRIGAAPTAASCPAHLLKLGMKNARKSARRVRKRARAR